MFVKINWLKIMKVLAEIKQRKHMMEEMGAAYMAEGVVTLAGSRMYTSMADTDEVIEATNGVEGLARYHDNLPDLVITDIVMPEKEGIELMIDLVKAAPDLKILAMSGAGKNKVGEYLPLAKCVGAIHTFSKPIDKRELLNAIARLFPRSTSTQSTR